MALLISSVIERPWPFLNWAPFSGVWPGGFPAAPFDSRHEVLSVAMMIAPRSGMMVENFIVENIEGVFVRGGGSAHELFEFERGTEHFKACRVDGFGGFEILVLHFKISAQWNGTEPVMAVGEFGGIRERSEGIGLP